MTDHPNYNDAVANLQRYLRRLVVFDEYKDINLVPIDGIFEEQTREALKEYQRTRGLPITGKAEKLTWDTLFAEYVADMRKNNRRAFPDIFPASPENYQTEFGEESAFIKFLQFILDELRISYDSLPPFEQSGIFDMDTSLAVKEFQRISLLPMTGRVNRDTWNYISDAYNAYARNTY